MAEVEKGPWEDFSPPSSADEADGPWNQFKPEAQKEIPLSPLISAAQGAAQGATFGFSDEALAAAKALANKFTNPQAGLRDSYKSEVQKERESVDKARKDNPYSFLAGNIAGNVGTSFIPGLGIAKGAGLGETLGKAALQGGLIGAGQSNADTIDTPFETLKDTASGAATGAAMQGLFSGLGALANKFSPSGLDKFAEERAVKASVGPNVGVLRKAIGLAPGGGNPEIVQDRISKMGRDILDEDVLSTLSKTEDLGPALKEAAQKYGSQIGEIGKTIDERLPQAVDTKKIAQDLADYAQTIPLTVGGKKIQDRILSEAANFEEMPSLGFGQAQQIKNQFKYKPVDQDALISNQDIANKIRQIIGRNMESATENVAKTGSDDVKDLLQRYQLAKSKYGTFKSASDAAGNETAKDLVRRIASPSDYATGLGAGLATFIASGGNPIALAVAVLGGAANKFSRERGSSTAAVIANNLSQTMKSSPKFAQEFGEAMMAAAQRGPAALTATHYMLMKNPRYRQQFEGQSSNEDKGVNQ